MKSILNYLFCILVAALLAYEISGSGGIFIIILLVTALVLSAAVMIVTYKTIRTDLKLSTDIAGKGDNFEAEFIIGKTTFLPTCFVEVTLGFTPNIASVGESVTFKAISAKRSGDIIKIPLNAELCGCGEVYAQSVTLMDYMGIFRRQLKNESVRRQIKIIPNIPDTGSQTELLKSTSENIAFDDSDEESDETAVGLTGVPGYEHRQYVSGDPLKRINWKLSSKRDLLMVRLDEKVTSSSQVFQLDYPAVEAPDKLYYRNADIIIESALAMLSMMLLSGFESDFNFFLDGWETVQVKDEKSLQYLQERLAGIKPYPAEHRMPDRNINEKGKAMICFTACTGTMTKELAVLNDSFGGSLVVTKSSGVGKLRSDMWQVSDEFEFSRMQ